MAERDEEKKADSDDDKLDKILKHMDSLHARMDAMEMADKARKDADEDKGEEFKRKDEAAKGGEEDDDISESEKKKADEEDADDEEEAELEAAKPKRVAADKKKKDSKKADAKDEDDDDDRSDSDDEDDKKGPDAVHKKADSMSDVRRRIDAVERLLPKQISDADYAAMADAQAKADSVFQAYGDSAPRPLQGENISAYRRRLARKLQTHSKKWAEADIMRIHDPAAFGIIEEQIYADAMEAAMQPVNLPAGQLREITRKDITGRAITTFVGDPASWMSPMSGYAQRARFNTNIRNQ
jgi:hypothetical protein